MKTQSLDLTPQRKAMLLVCYDMVNLAVKPKYNHTIPVDVRIHPPRFPRSTRVGPRQCHPRASWPILLGIFALQDCMSLFRHREFQKLTQEINSEDYNQVFEVILGATKGVVLQPYTKLVKAIRACPQGWS